MSCQLLICTRRSMYRIMLVLKHTSASDFFFLCLTWTALHHYVGRSKKPSQRKEKKNCSSASYVSMRIITWMSRGLQTARNLCYVTAKWTSSQSLRQLTVVTRGSTSPRDETVHTRKLERAATTWGRAVRSTSFFFFSFTKHGRKGVTKHNGLGRCAWWSRCALKKGKSLSVSKSNKLLRSSNIKHK